MIMDDEEDTRAFVVVKFVDDGDETEDVSFEIGLSKWLHSVKDNSAKIRWPRNSRSAGNKVRNGANYGPDWPSHQVQLLRYYNTYLKAVEGLNGFVESSTYETDHELGKGKRKKFGRRDRQHSQSPSTSSRRPNKRANTIESDSEEEDTQRGSRKKVCEAPAIDLPALPVTHENGKSKVKIADTSAKKSLVNRAVLQNVKTQVSAKDRLKAKLALIVEGRSKKPVTENTKLADKSSEKKNLVDVTKGCGSEATPVKSKNKETVKKTFNKQHEAAGSSQNGPSPAKTASLASSPVQIVSSPQCPRYKAFDKDHPDISDASKNGTPNSIRDLCLGSPGSYQYGDKSGEKFENSAGSLFVSPMHDYPHSSHGSSPGSGIGHVRNLFKTPPKDLNKGKNFGDVMKRLDVIEANNNKIMLKQVETSTKLDSVLIQQAQLNHFLLPKDKRLLRPSALPPLPVNSEEALDKLEEFLNNDNNLTATASYLSTFVLNKHSESQVTYNLLKIMMTNTLACEYNFTGEYPKKTFNKLLFKVPSF